MDMYKLESGNCEVYTGYGTEHESILGILSKGAYFGEIGFFAQKPSIYTVISYTDVLIDRIIITEFQKYAQEHYEDMLSLMKNMTDSMYNLKFNMDLMMREEENRKKDATAGDMYMREQLKKYNLVGMKSLSFFSSKC